MLLNGWKLQTAKTKPNQTTKSIKLSEKNYCFLLSEPNEIAFLVRPEKVEYL